MTQEERAAYKKKARESGKALSVFDSVKVDRTHPGKLKIFYKSFYPDGKVERLAFTNVSNPFNANCIEYTTDRVSGLLRNGEEFFVTLYLNATQLEANCKVILEDEPDVIEVTMEDIEKKFGRKVKIIG